MNSEPQLLFCKENISFPNNKLPAILYKQAFDLGWFLPSRPILALFKRHCWTNSWESGIFTYPHYHSTTHEVLGFYKGATELQLGGDKGHIVTVEKGDVLIIPAGVAHCNLGEEDQVECVGAYPDGRRYDIRTGQPGERPASDKNIAKVPMPEYDPFYGKDEGVQLLWSLVNII